MRLWAVSPAWRARNVPVGRAKLEAVPVTSPQELPPSPGVVLRLEVLVDTDPRPTMPVPHWQELVLKKMRCQDSDYRRSSATRVTCGTTDTVLGTRPLDSGENWRVSGAQYDRCP